MLITAWAGIRFLSGFDIFSRNAVYYAGYDQVNGVQSASPIMMKGVKIGTVTGISLDPTDTNEVVLTLTVKRHYKIPADSEAKIVSNGLMGSKAIEIVYGASHTYLESGDMMQASRDADLMDIAGSELDFFKQKIAQITADLSRMLNNMSEIMETNAGSIEGAMGNLNTFTAALAAERNNLRKSIAGLTEFSTMLGENAPRIDSMIGSFNNIATQLDEEEFGRKLTATVGNIDALLAKINDGEGTAGKLVTDTALYDSLTLASGNLASLLADLQAYPGRYVHLSVFGKDADKAKAKAEKKAAKAAEKARLDSLKQSK